MFQILRRIFSKNLVEVGENNIVNNTDFPKCMFEIFGDNNRIDISSDTKMTGKIRIFGDDNFIKIGSKCYIKGEIEFGYEDFAFNCPARRCSLQIGDRVYLAKRVRVSLAEEKTKVSIGDDCAFANGTKVLASDMLSYFDEKEDGDSSFIRIGKHVWFCTDTTILKNSVVNDDSIVAAGTIVNKQFWETHVTLGKHPVQIIRRGVTWSKLSPGLYLKKQQEQKQKE